MLPLNIVPILLKAPELLIQAVFDGRRLGLNCIDGFKHLSRRSPRLDLTDSGRSNLRNSRMVSVCHKQPSGQDEQSLAQ